jgi:hypothetical protein
LRAAGHKVIASDLVNCGIPITPPGYYGVDFLLEHKLPADVELICTNPPFKLAGEFVEHALALCPQVIMLLRLAFLESERRSAILEGCGLARLRSNMHEARHGWIKFAKGDGEGVERHTMLIMECPELPPCPACGNIVDEHDDKRCDWRPVVYLPLRSVTDPDDVVGTGKGARRAVAQLPTVGKDLNDELQHGDHQSRAGR